MSGKTRPLVRPVLRRAAALLLAAGLLAGLAPNQVAPARAADTPDKAATATASPNGWTAAANALNGSDDGVVATATGDNVDQDYRDFSFGIPAGSIITGITVKANAWSSDSAGCKLSARLSWNDGASYTSRKTVDLNADTGAIVTLGSTSDAWGQVWDRTQTTNSAFRLQVRNEDPGTECSGTTSLDWVTVALTYDTIKKGTANADLGSEVCEAADFNFVIDMSGSIGPQGSAPSNLPDLKAGITGFVSAFQAAGGSGRYSGTRFNESSASLLTSGYTDDATFTTAVNALSNPSGWTPTATGITSGAGNNANDRAGIPNVMFVVTDGSPNRPNTTGTDTGNPLTWLQAANAAVTAADDARAGSGASKYIVKAVYLSTDNDPGDTSLPFSAAGDAEWAKTVMQEIGGGSYFNADFTAFVDDLFKAIGCKPPALEITKTADDGTVSAGASIGFTIGVENKGGKAAHDVVVTDTLPGSLAWSISPAVDGCSISGGTLTCSFGTLAAGASASVHVTADTGAACGVYDNTAALTSSDAGGGQASASVNVLCPDVKVTKTPNAGTVSRGETATFSIKVENVGDGTAKDVVVTDTLPAGFGWTEDEADCSIAGGILTCTAGNLSSGASKTYTVSADTDLAACVAIPNTASASASNEVAGGNNSDDASITVQCSDIAITKTADAPSVSAGDEIGFTITVTNTGAGTAFDVSATDELDARFAWSLDPTSAGWNLSGTTLSFSAASLAPDASSSVHVVATPPIAVCGAVDNKATVTTGDGDDAEATAGTEILCPDLHVTKTAKSGTISAGDEASFTMTVVNDGQGVARGASLSDTLPAGAAWAIADTDGTCAIAAGVLTCDFGDLAAGESGFVTVSGATSPAACGTLDNKVTVSAANETNLAGNTAEASIIVNCPDITVSKTAADSPINAGDTASFTITVHNAGPGTARTVVLEDALPAGITWVITPAVPGCSIIGSDLSCTVDTLEADASFSVTIAGVTSQASCAPIDNTAHASAANERRQDSANNTGSASITVDCPDVTVSKTAANSPISAGDSASFVITVKNVGQGIARDVTLTDPLPGGIAWVVDDLEHCSIVDSTLGCEFGDLASGASVTINVSGETTADTCTTIDNTASVAAANEAKADTGNNQSTASIVVNCPTISFTKTAVQPVVNAGDDVEFKITVSNNGAGSAYQVYVEDVLPTNPGTKWGIKAEGSDPGFSIDGTKVTFGPATLAAGESRTVVIHSGTTPETCGVVDNTATMTYSGGKAANGASVTVQCPAITVEKTAGDGEISAGDVASYTITISNAGPGVAYGATITDQLPAGVTWSDDSAWCSITDGVLSCTFEKLEVKESHSVTVTGTTTAAVCGVLHNEASATAANAPGEPATGQADITVQCADVAVTKTAFEDEILVGDQVAFEIVVSSVGLGTARDVVLKDELPAGLDWTVDYADASEACAIASGTLTCDIGSLDEGATFTVRVSAPTTEQTIEACDIPATIPNTATVSATNEPQNALGNNTDDASTDVLCADVSLVKTAGNAADGTVLKIAKPGSVVFTYVVTNTGTADLENVKLVDDNATPANTADDITITDCDPASTTLAAGATMTCTATLPVAVGTRTNIATVTACVASTGLQPASRSEVPVCDEVSDSDDAVVLVPELVTPKPTPKVTPPPTSTLDGADNSTTGTTGLLLVLAALAGLMLAAGYLRPARATARRRSRRG